MFNYELEIKLDSKEELPPVIAKEGEWIAEDQYQYKDLYYGFQVKDIGVYPGGKQFMDRVFTMTGRSTLEELKTMFKKLADEIVSSDTPPKLFKAGTALLSSLLMGQDEKDFSDNLEYEVSRQWPSCGVRLYLYKEPAPVKKDPDPDGCVTGSLWRVKLKLNGKTAKSASVQYDEDVYCIKPESAVHEAIDKMLHIYSGILDKYVLETPIMVCKMTDTIRFPYIIVEDKQ